MTTTIILAGTLLAVTALVCAAASRAWRGWLELKRVELDRHGASPEAGGDDMALRIELAAVRERLRRLEDIASCVEL